MTEQIAIIITIVGALIVLGVIAWIFDRMQVKLLREHNKKMDRIYADHNEKMAKMYREYGGR